MFEQGSNIVINGGHFYYDGSTWQVGRTPQSRVLDSLQRIIQKDSDFNEYSSTNQTLTLPVLTKESLLNITGITTNSPSRPASISCCFELIRRLGLLQSQQTLELVEYEQHIPIPRVVTRNSCCCALISRHGFVHLVSRFFQNASTSDAPGTTSTITINTTIGRFRCYDIDDRVFVHFDGSTRAAPSVKLVDDQDLDHILRVARRQYLVKGRSSSAKLTWRILTEEEILAFASDNYFSLPDAIMYMSRDKVATWTFLRSFGKMLATCTLEYIDTLSKPESFAQLLATHHAPGFEVANIDTSAPPRALSVSIYVYRHLLQVSPTDIKYELYYTVASRSINALMRMLEHFTGSLAQGEHIRLTGKQYFIRMFQACHNAQQSGPAPMAAMVTSELQSLIQRDENNFLLVIYHIFSGYTAYWNAARILKRSRSVPSSWIQFISAEDDYVYLG